MNCTLNLRHPPCAVLEPAPIPIYRGDPNRIPILSDMYLLIILRLLQSDWNSQLVPSQRLHRVIDDYCWEGTPEGNEFWEAVREENPESDASAFLGWSDDPEDTESDLRNFKLLLAELVAKGLLQEKNTKPLT